MLYVEILEIEIFLLDKELVIDKGSNSASNISTGSEKYLQRIQFF